jgi:hypothetical protein
MGQPTIFAVVEREFAEASAATSSRWPGGPWPRAKRVQVWTGGLASRVVDFWPNPFSHS